MADKEVSIRFKVNDDGSVVLEGISQNLKKIETNTQGVGNSLKLIKFDSLINLGERAFHAGERIYQLAKTTASALNDIDRLSKVAGMSSEQFQKMQYAAKMTDVEAGDLATGLKKLSQAMDDATRGAGEASGWFNAMGISVKDADGKLKSLNKIMGEIADKFASWEDGPRKIAIAVDLFGRSGQNLIPYLNQGAEGIKKYYQEFEKLGFVLDESIIKKGSQLEDQFKRIDTFLDTMWKRVVVKGAEILSILAEIAAKGPHIFILEKLGEHLKEKSEIYDIPGIVPTPKKTGQPPAKESPEDRKRRFGIGGGMPSWMDVIEKAEFEERLRAIKYATEGAVDVQMQFNKALPEAANNTSSWLDALENLPAGFAQIGDVTAKISDLEAKTKAMKSAAIEISWEDVASGLEKISSPGERAANTMAIIGERAAQAAIQSMKWNDQLAENLSNAWGINLTNIIRGTESMSEKIKSLFKGIGDAFLSTISKMVSNWLIFGNLTGKSKAKGGGWGGLVGVIASLFHKGGIVGSEGQAGMVSAGTFLGAPRFHGGFTPNEYPAILQKGEGVFTPDQMRALSPAKKADSSGNTFVYISAIDAKSFDDMVSRNPDSIIKVIEKDARGAGSMRKIIRST